MHSATESYECTEVFILDTAMVEDSSYIFIWIGLPLWLIYLALIAMLNQLLSIILNLLLSLGVHVHKSVNV